MFNNGDRVRFTCSGKSGIYQRLHEVNGACYVLFDGDRVHMGVYIKDLEREASSPFMDSVHAYIRSELYG